MSETTNKVSDHRPQTSDLRSPSSDRSSPSGSGPRLEKPIRITEQVWPQGMLPVVSICCITYQHVNFIRDAIEGFLMQETTFPVEIIIRDDASTDGTDQIVRDYEAKFPQLIRTILHAENQYSKGKKAFPETFAMVRGEFIAICEGDDYWISKEKLQKQVEVLDANQDISLVFHNAWAKHAGQSHKDWLFTNHLKFYKTRYTLSDLVLLRWFIATGTIVYRKNVKYLDDIAKFAFGGDLVIQLSAALAGDFYYVDEIYTIYRRHENSMAHSLYFDNKEIYEKYKPNYFWTLYCMLAKVTVQSDKKALWLRMEKTILEIAEYLLGEGNGKNGAQIISNTTNIISKKKPDIVNSSESNLEIDEVISRVVQSFIHNNYKNKIKNLSSSKKYVDSFSEICYALNDNNISNKVKAKLIAIFLVWSFNAFFKKKSIA